MASAFIKSLPEDVKPWFSQAVAGMILASGKIEPAELFYLEGTLMFLGQKEEVDKIVEIVKTKEKPLLPALKTNKVNAARMFIELATVAVKDDKLSVAEEDYFVHIGNRLGYDPSFSKKILAWANRFCVVDHEKKQLTKEAEDIYPNQ